jgi:hypothetical protein
MSADHVSTGARSSRRRDAKLVRYDDYIDAKIQSTRRAVKLVDLAATLVALAAGVLAYLMAVAVVEHWLVRDGFTVAARTALFAILLIGVGYFACRRLWPLIARAINPVYAARTIEQGSPSLKNSLINLLLFREHRAEIPDAVYQTLEEQAAQRLTKVPTETAVDRSTLIRLGYVFLFVIAAAGTYKILSPKDPVTVAERILMPWADIVPASRVTITEIKPGSSTVSRGESVDVSAEVHGLRDEDEVLLRYTTIDGQVTGKAIPMRPAGDGRRFLCRVADEADGTQRVGLTRDLTYRLEAGDARSLDYRIRVVAAPSILVERVEYHYPRYTGFVDRSVDGLGDIRAIEGTRVTVHAKANGAIHDADVDFDVDGRPDLRMTSSENQATAAFDLALREDRQTPSHASYVLRFTDDDGRTNRDPVKHSIAVERDFDPEASILLPKEKSIDVRLDESVPIEVEARDPDFALSAVRLRGEAAGRPVLDEPLLNGEHRGRFAGRYSFVPKAHALQPGDTVEYWVEAADNRAPKPNLAVTQKKLMRIVSPNPAQQPPPDRLAKNDRQQPRPGEQPDGAPRQNQDQKGKGGGAGEQAKGQQQPDKSAGDQQKPNQNKQPQNGEKNQGGSGSGESGNSIDQKSSDSENKAHSGGKDNKTENAGKDSNQARSGDQSQDGQQSKPDQSQSGQQKSQKEQTGAGASGSQSSKDTEQPVGARPDQANGSADRTQKRENQTRPEKKESPISPEGDNDGEAFDRIQQHLERKGDLKNNEKSGGDAESEQQSGRKAEQHAEKQIGNPPKDAHSKQDGEQTKAGTNEQKSMEKGDSAVNEKPDANDKSSEKPGERNGQKSSDQRPKNSAEGSGAKTRPDDASEKNKETRSDRHEEQKSSGGEQTSKGPAGSGDEQKSKGSPNSQPQMKSGEKREQLPSKEHSNQQEPPAGANGKRENDSHGEQGGDKTGGGEEGAGQKAPRQGTGSSGQNESADQGAGESGEKGKGRTSPNAGKDAKSEHRTAESGGEKGEGTNQRDGQGNLAGGKPADGNAANEKSDRESGSGGDQKGARQDGEKPAGGNRKGKSEAKKSDKETGRQGDKETAKSADDVKGNEASKGGKDADKSKTGKDNGTPGGAQSGGGQPGMAVNPQRSITGEAPEGDEANLEYARKQTDLVLEKLSDQLARNKVDDRLLKDLGWSRDDLRRFVERWQQRKAAAQREDPSGDASKRELDDALRSLGLRRGKLQQSAAKKDTMRDLKEGYRGPVPLEYQERLRAYNQGVSRAHRDGE